MEKETIMEPKMFTADEIDSSFSATGWSPDESECMALNPAPDGKGVVVSALEKIGDSYAFAAENTDGIAHYTEKQRKQHLLYFSR